jgi:hypothetical protein
VNKTLAQLAASIDGRVIDDSTPINSIVNGYMTYEGTNLTNGITLAGQEKGHDFRVSCDGVPDNFIDVSLQIPSPGFDEIVTKSPRVLLFWQRW